MDIETIETNELTFEYLPEHNTIRVYGLPERELDTNTEEFNDYNVTMEFFRKFGCDGVLKYLRNDREMWASRFAELLRIAAIHCSEEQDPKGYEEIRTTQLYAFLISKSISFEGQLSRGEKPHNGRVTIYIPEDKVTS